MPALETWICLQNSNGDSPTATLIFWRQNMYLVLWVEEFSLRLSCSRLVLVMATCDIDPVYDSIKDHWFVLYEVKKNFSPVSMLSASGLSLVLGGLMDSQGIAKAVKFNRLIDLSSEGPPVLEEHRLRDVINSCEKQQFHIEPKIGKINVVCAFAKQILIPLFGEVMFESGYKDDVKGLKGATVTNLGIGSADTWHGGSELRVRGCDFISTDQYLPADNDEEEEDSNDSCRYKLASSYWEGMKINQLVGTCVINSFTNKNLKPDLNPMVPTVLFNQSAFRVCLYDSHNDVLLISRPKLLTTHVNTISKTAVFMLWIVVHHRAFFKRLDEGICKHQSHIKQKLQADNSLQKYETLNRRDLDWSTYRYPDFSPPTAELSPPQSPKKPLPSPKKPPPPKKARLQ